jgi:hypothetical protein
MGRAQRVAGMRADDELHETHRNILVGYGFA